MTGLVAWLEGQVEAGASGAPQGPAIVAAHRAILAMHKDDGLGWCTSCGALTNDDYDRAPVEAPCDTLRALAAAYAGQPGYNPGWAL